MPLRKPGSKRNFKGFGRMSWPGQGAGLRGSQGGRGGGSNPPEPQIDIGPRAVLLGDSMTVQNVSDNGINSQGYFNWLNFGANQYFSMEKNAGVAGNTIAQMLARHGTDVVPIPHDTLFLLGGVNDISQGRSANDIYADILAIAALEDSASANVVVFTPLPSNDFNSAQATEMFALRDLLLADATSNIKVIDITNAYIDTGASSGAGVLPFFTSDGTHPTAQGAAAIGNIALTALDGDLTGTPEQVTGVELAINGDFSGTAGQLALSAVGQVADQWVGFGNIPVNFSKGTDSQLMSWTEKGTYFIDQQLIASGEKTEQFVVELDVDSSGFDGADLFFLEHFFLDIGDTVILRNVALEATEGVSDNIIPPASGRFRTLPIGVPQNAEYMKILMRPESRSGNLTFSDARLVRLPQVGSFNNRAVLFGDSNTAQHDSSLGFHNQGYFHWLNCYIGQYFELVSNEGVGGDTYADLLGRYAADVAPLAFDTLFLNAGVNDFAAGASAEDVYADFVSIIELASDDSVNVIAIVPLPNSNYTAPQLDEVLKFRRMIMAHNTDNLRVIDVWPLLADANGAPIAEVTRDDMVHLNAKGANIVGRTIALDLAGRFSGTPYLPLGTLINVNSEFAGTSGGQSANVSGDVADGYYIWASSAVVASKEADGAEFKQVVTLTNAATVQLQRTISSNLQIGEQYIADVELELGPVNNVNRFQLEIDGRTGSTIIDRTFCLQNTDNTHNEDQDVRAGTYRFRTPPLTLPSGTDNIHIRFQMDGDVGDVVKFIDARLVRL